MPVEACPSPIDHLDLSQVNEISNTAKERVDLAKALIRAVEKPKAKAKAAAAEAAAAAAAGNDQAKNADQKSGDGEATA